MEREEQEIEKKLKEFDLDTDYSKWKIGDNIEYILTPFSLNSKLQMIKIKEGNPSRIDFKLLKHNNLIIFHELLSDLKYGFDITDINLDKIYFRVPHSDNVVIWKKLLTESTNDLLKYFD
jgi:hypothetical protein